MAVEALFPVAIYREDNLIASHYNREIANYFLGISTKIKSGGEAWFGGTYTTHKKYQLASDGYVAPLLELITSHVNRFANMLGSASQYNCDSAWFNINTENTFQEFHTHNNSIFSCAYYVSAPEGSGGIVFEDPKEPDMFQMKEVRESNPFNQPRVVYEVEEGTLLIFRSYLRHAVIPGTNKQPRISISANFS